MKGLISTLKIITVLFIILFTAKTEVYANSGTVITYDKPSNLPSKYTSTDYQINVNGSPLHIFNGGNNVWGNKVSFTSFDFSGAITIEVTPNFTFNTVTILPRTENISYTRVGNKLTFTLSDAKNLTFIFDGNFQGKALHLFAQDLEVNIPSSSDSSVMYFGPGYYDYSGQTPLIVPAGKTLYIAGGAVLRGRVVVSGGNNITIRGKGILLNDYNSNDGYDSVALAIKSAKNITIEDIIISRDAGSWSAFMYKTEDVTVDRVKIINPRYASSDGFNIANAKNILFNEMFIRSCDDCVAIKGTGSNGYTASENPAVALPNYNITIQNSQVWSDANNALGIGAETVTESYDLITFRNIDILYNFDDINYPDYFTERAALNICALNATYFRNITFEDIRLEKGKRLIGIDMSDSFWFGSIQGNWNWNGNMQNIKFKNITSYSDGSNEIRIYGRDNQHNVSNITFENIIVNNQKILNFQNSLFQVNSFVNDFKIINNGVQVATSNGPFGSNVHDVVKQFETIQGANNWYYRTWTPGVGNLNMSWNPDQSFHWRGQQAYDAVWIENNNMIIHPDSNQTMVEWKAPKAGEVNVVGTVKKFDIGGGDGVVVSIWKNNEMIWPSNWTTIAYNNSVGLSHNFMTHVSAGDIISYRVDQGSNSAYDSTAWNTTIIYE